MEETLENSLEGWCSELSTENVSDPDDEDATVSLELALSTRAAGQYLLWTLTLPKV